MPPGPSKRFVKKLRTSITGTMHSRVSWIAAQLEVPFSEAVRLVLDAGLSQIEKEKSDGIDR
jgi:hypothetical protein